MPLSVERFVAQLEDSGIIASDTIRDFLPPQRHPRDTEELARELVRQKKLTKFQVEEVSRGKGKSLVLGNYTILDKIGAGGMGQVFRAEHRRMKRVVAVKLLPAALMKDPAVVARFEREVTAVARLNHPNIVTAFDADNVSDVHLLVMEYVEGADLAALVRKKGPLPVAQALDYIRQAASGLQAAHAEGIIHRDIKPANLLLDKKGTVKILDLGLARLNAGGDSARQADLTHTGTIMGTVDYMSPEQALNTKYADRRADVYSLGCSLYFLLTGTAVYSGESLMEKLLAHREQPIPSLAASRPEVPPQLDEVFARMIAKNAEDRYQTMEEVLDALSAIASGTPAAPPSVLSGASDDAAVRDFLAAISPVSGAADVPAGSGSAVSGKAAASGSLSRAASAGTPVPSLRLARERLARLSPRQWMLVAACGTSVVVLAMTLFLNLGKKPAPEDQPETIAAAQEQKGLHDGKSPPGDSDPNGKLAWPGDRAGNESSQANRAAWKNLFDGRTLAGWSKLGGGEWVARDGVLTTVAAGTGWLMSDAEYGDFQLELEYRLPPAGNSGVFLRGWPEGDSSGGQFLEIQLLDDNAPAYRGVPREGKTGAIYGTVAPDPAPNAPAGQWNQIAIRAAGRRVQISVNGRKVVDANLDDFKTNFARFPGLARARGRVGLQQHNHSGIEFRNIRLREIAGGPPTAVAPFDAAGAAKYQRDWAAHLDVPVEVLNAAGLKMRLIPPGEFQMGSDEAELAGLEDWAVERSPDLVPVESPVRQVRITHPFRISATEVTVRQFRQFVAETKYVTEAERAGAGSAAALSNSVQREAGWRTPDFPQTDEHPVVAVNRNDAQEFCTWLTNKEQVKYRLPTEAEWEFACRAGTQSLWATGKVNSGLDALAWFDKNVPGGTHPVGSKAPNAFGIFDMYGNAWEWCADNFDATIYRQSPVDDPAVATPGDAILRGGSFLDAPQMVRPAIRFHRPGHFSVTNFGFRVVCEPGR